MKTLEIAKMIKDDIDDLFNSITVQQGRLKYLQALLIKIEEKKITKEVKDEQ